MKQVTKQENFAIVVGFAIMVIAVFSCLFLNAAFGTPVDGTVIWSGKGLAVLFLAGIVEMIFHLCVYRKEVNTMKKSLCTKIFFSMLLIYLCGIVIGAIFLNVAIGINPTTTPIWSDAGAGLGYWCSFMGWCAGYIIRKLD